MPRVSRNSIIKDQHGATYYIESRTLVGDPVFSDPELRDWVYEKTLRLSSLFYVNLRAVTVVDDRVRMVLSMNKPRPQEAEVAKRFHAIQAENRVPIKWYAWRMREWHRKLADLSEFMKRLNQSIAQRVHMVRGDSGQVWRDRFHAELLDSDLSVLSAMAFVELSCLGSSKDGLAPVAYDHTSLGRLAAGGRRAAGVTLPRKALFRFLGKGEARYQAWCHFVSYLAELSEPVKRPALLRRYFEKVAPADLYYRSLGHQAH